MLINKGILRKHKIKALYSIEVKNIHEEEENLDSFV